MKFNDMVDKILEDHWKLWKGDRENLSFIADPGSRAHRQKLVPVSKDLKKARKREKKSR